MILEDVVLPLPLNFLPFLMEDGDKRIELYIQGRAALEDCEYAPGFYWGAL